MNLGVLVAAVDFVAAIVAHDGVAVDVGVATNDVLVAAVAPAVDLVVVASQVPPCLLGIAHLLGLPVLDAGITKFKLNASKVSHFYNCTRAKSVSKR